MVGVNGIHIMTKTCLLRDTCRCPVSPHISPEPVPQDRPGSLSESREGGAAARRRVVPAAAPTPGTKPAGHTRIGWHCKKTQHNKIC
jgi:hypothetical protein